MNRTVSMVPTRHSNRRGSPPVDALAEGLDILYDSPVKQVRIVPPSPPFREKQLRRTSATATEKQPAVGSSCGRRRSSRARHSVERLTIDHAAATNAFSTTRRTTTSDDNTIHKKKKTIVHVTLQNGTILEADTVLCTLPLGVLKLSLEDSNESKERNDKTKQQHKSRYGTRSSSNRACVRPEGYCQFDPPLPKQKQRAIAALGTGLLNKCILAFPHVFWQDSDFLGLADKDQSYLVLNVTAYSQGGKPVLIFMFGGDFAAAVEDWKDSDIVEDCLRVLRKMCGLRHVPPPVDYRVTRWGKEPYSRMSFTYIPPGVDGFSELRVMSQPIYGCEVAGVDHHYPKHEDSAGDNNGSGKIPVLQFAGEHTSLHHPSTIHGAFLSGIREAYRLDLVLHPEHNDHLAFSEKYMFQRTFPLKRKVPRSGKRKYKFTSSSFTGSNNASNSSNSNQLSKQSILGTMKGRSRGTAGVMSLRRNPKTTSLLVRSSGGNKKRTIAEKVSSSTVSTRRSQRTPKKNSLVDTKDNEHQQMITNRKNYYRRNLRVLEDRMLDRGVESYGRDFAWQFKRQ